MGQESSVAEVREQVAKMKVHDNVSETLDRTLKHLGDNKVDLEKSKMTLGVKLEVSPKSEEFVGNASANKFLTREYRKPFVVPTEKEI